MLKNLVGHMALSAGLQTLDWVAGPAGDRNPGHLSLNPDFNLLRL
jgi:hypothetical protein